MPYSIVVELEKPIPADIQRLANLRFGTGCKTSFDKNTIVYEFETKKRRDEGSCFLHELLKANIGKFSGCVASYHEPEYSERLKKEADAEATARAL